MPTHPPSLPSTATATVAGVRYANRDPALNWSDVAWFKKKTSMKIVIKGVQTGLDAVLAAKAGVDAIILSNHGGRNLDSARSGIEVLPEVMRDLRDAGLEGDIEVFVDGGIRRGTDVLKVRDQNSTTVIIFIYTFRARSLLSPFDLLPLPSPWLRTWCPQGARARRDGGRRREARRVLHVGVWAGRHRKNAADSEGA